MPKAKPLNEILNIAECNELVSEFYSYLIEKKNSKQELNDVEDVVYLLVNLLLDIEMEGFVDLFSEGKSIYIKSKFDITQEEYRQIDLSTLDETPNYRLNEIGKIILAKDSEIYHLGDYICQFIKTNITILQKGLA